MRCPKKQQKEYASGAARSKRPNVVLSDIVVEDGDGLDWLRDEVKQLKEKLKQNKLGFSTCPSDKARGSKRKKCEFDGSDSDSTEDDEHIPKTPPPKKKLGAAAQGDDLNPFGGEKEKAGDANEGDTQPFYIKPLGGGVDL